jgi:putative transposase
MNNHVHLLAVPERADSLARTLGRTHADYGRYWNARRASCGHVWQARFYSCPLEHSQVWKVARYVEVNPVRAEIVPQAEQWPWSSAMAHVTERDPSGLLELQPWMELYDGARWRDVLRTSVDDEAWKLRLEDATRRGRPLGSEEFAGDLERNLGRVVRPRTPGRPRKVSEPAGVEERQLALEIGN